MSISRSAIELYIVAVLRFLACNCNPTDCRRYNGNIGDHPHCGEILLKQNPAGPAPAEAAFLAAIAVAQQQKARSFELRAALSLAKLYRATGRHTEAHAALGPAVEGFSPTPEVPEVGDAQALVATVEADARL